MTSSTLKSAYTRYKSCWHLWSARAIENFNLHLILSWPIFLILCSIFIAEVIAYFLLTILIQCCEKAYFITLSLFTYCGNRASHTWEESYMQPAKHETVASAHFDKYYASTHDRTPTIFTSSLRQNLKFMINSTKFDEYSHYAMVLDKLSGRNEWKNDVKSKSFNHDDILKCINHIRIDTANQNITSLLDHLKKCISLYGSLFTNEDMYSHTYHGTKIILQSAVNQIMSALQFLREAPKNYHSEIKKQIKDIAFQWGSSGLILSGGAMLGAHHLGICDVLIEPISSLLHLYNNFENTNCLPKYISGASAGAGIAAWLCTRTDDELKQQCNSQFFYENFNGLKPDSWILRIRNLISKGYVCDIHSWEISCKKLFGHMTFREAYKKTKRVLNISMSRAEGEKEVVVLNYMNAPYVLIYTAVLASCAFPFLAPPYRLKQKLPDKTLQDFNGHYFQDGSLTGDIPLSYIRSKFHVCYSIVSQVNLHVFPFMHLRAKGDAGNPISWRGRYGQWRAGFVLSALNILVKENLRFLLRLAALLNICPSLRGINAGSLAFQSYSGDITLTPNGLSLKYLKFISTLSMDEYDWFVQKGRQMVFPKMFLILNRMRIEKGLESILEAFS